jgi:hypothetical protein
LRFWDNCDTPISLASLDTANELLRMPISN